MSKQVTAILCAGADHPALHLIPTLISDSTDVIYVGIDRGALGLVRAGYPLTYALGDFDSVTDQEFEEIEVHSQETYRVQAEKDDTDTELAFEWVQSHYPQATVYLFGAMGASMIRLDHKISNIYLAYQPRFSEIILRTTLIEDNLRIRWYGPGQHQLKAGHSLPDYLSIISMTPVKGLAIQGAKYNLPPTDISYPRAYVSNEFVSNQDEVILSVEEGLLMVQWVDERSI